MRYAVSAALILAFLLVALVPAPSASQENPSIDVEEHNNGPARRPGATNTEIEEALKLVHNFSQPASLSFNDSDAKNEALIAKKAKTNLVTERGDPNSKYDVVIQVGHYPRASGATGGEGKFITEQEAAAWVASMLSQKLIADGRKVLVIPADDFQNGIKTKVFIALHTDSAKLKCAVGPSLGYGSATNKHGMDMLAVAVAVSLAIEPRKFMADNYTKNLSGYYAYSRVSSSDFEGVLEMIELSCPDQERKLLVSGPILAENLRVAIQLALR